VGKIAVIGGSGLYSMPGLEVLEEKEIKTPFGEPSAPIVVSRLGKQEVIFLARHGIGHHLSPSEVNYRANIYALKSLGVEMILGISACGSLREDFSPGISSSLISYLISPRIGSVHFSLVDWLLTSMLQTHSAVTWWKLFTRL